MGKLNVITRVPISERGRVGEQRFEDATLHLHGNGKVTENFQSNNKHLF